MCRHAEYFKPQRGPRRWHRFSFPLHEHYDCGLAKIPVVYECVTIYLPRAMQRRWHVCHVRRHAFIIFSWLLKQLWLAFEERFHLFNIILTEPPKGARVYYTCLLCLGFELSFITHGRLVKVNTLYRGVSPWSVGRLTMPKSIFVLEALWRRVF